MKWGAADAKLDEGHYPNGQKALIYVFDTAWEPPIPWLEKVSSDYPLLRFELSFRDPNSNWVDEYVFQDGNQIEEED